MRLIVIAVLVAPLLVQDLPVAVQTPPTTSPGSLAISPDGEKIVFTARTEGKAQLWLHSLATGTARPLTDTDGTAPVPCWSPDSRSIAYFENAKLKMVAADAGAARTLVDINSGSGQGCSWNKDGTILMAMGATRAILRVSESGGAPQPATPPDAVYYQRPHMLPDARHFLFFAVGSGIHVGDLGGTPPRKLLDNDSGAVYSRSGHLLFVRQGTLYAQKFDLAELQLKDKPFQVAERVVPGSVSTSTTGSVVYRTDPGSIGTQLKWFDRAGREVGSVAEVTAMGASAPMLSPDGRTMVLGRNVGGNLDIWLLEVATGELSQLTTDPAFDMWPAWSADGKTIYFASTRSGRWELYQRPASPDGSERLVMRQAATRIPGDVSRDGRFLLYSRSPNTTVANNIGAVQLDGNPPADISVVQGPGDHPKFSPDGRWIAYEAASSGRSEIFIQQFPSGKPQAISNSGGANPQWNPNGKELFYVAPDGKLFSVPLEFGEDSLQVRVGTAAGLFSGEIAPAIYGSQYIVAEDGQRFLIATVAEVRSPIQVIRNWQPKN